MVNWLPVLLCFVLCCQGNRRSLFNMATAGLEEQALEDGEQSQGPARQVSRQRSKRLSDSSSESLRRSN
jgi:hypothetical protein